MIQEIQVDAFHKGFVVDALAGRLFFQRGGTAERRVQCPQEVVAVIVLEEVDLNVAVVVGVIVQCKVHPEHEGEIVQCDLGLAVGAERAAGQIAAEFQQGKLGGFLPGKILCIFFVLLANCGHLTDLLGAGHTGDGFQLGTQIFFQAVQQLRQRFGRCGAAACGIRTLLYQHKVGGCGGHVLLCEKRVHLLPGRRGKIQLVQRRARQSMGVQVLQQQDLREQGAAAQRCQGIDGAGPGAAADLFLQQLRARFRGHGIKGGAVFA